MLAYPNLCHVLILMHVQVKSNTLKWKLNYQSGISRQSKVVDGVAHSTIVLHATNYSTKQFIYQIKIINKFNYGGLFNLKALMDRLLGKDHKRIGIK